MTFPIISTPTMPINLGANYKFAKGATIGLAIDNLLDKDYWSWYYYGAGRTYTVKLSYEF